MMHIQSCVIEQESLGLSNENYELSYEDRPKLRNDTSIKQREMSRHILTVAALTADQLPAQSSQHKHELAHPAHSAQRPSPSSIIFSNGYCCNL